MPNLETLDVLRCHSRVLDLCGVFAELPTQICRQCFTACVHGGSHPWYYRSVPLAALCMRYVLLRRSVFGWV